MFKTEGNVSFKKFIGNFTLTMENILEISFGFTEEELKELGLIASGGVISEPSCEGGSEGWNG